MTESVSATEKKVRALLITSAVLAVVSLTLAAALITQHNRRETAATSQLSPLTARPAAVTAPAIAKTLPAPAPGFAANHFNQQDPFEEFDAMSRKMSNMMRRAFMMGVPIMNSLNANSGFDFTPAVDLEETATAYVLRSDLPGLDKDKINVTVRNNIVTLEGTRETSQENRDPSKGVYSQERSYGSFSRSLSLPGPVDDTKIQATYQNGVLTVTLPKIAKAQDLKKVAIQ